jgi:hypothetical protein
MKAAVILRPEKQQHLKNISLSTDTVAKVRMTCKEIHDVSFKKRVNILWGIQFHLQAAQM